MHRDARLENDGRDGRMVKIERDLIRKWVDGNRQRENLITWMIPSENYKYKELSKNKESNGMKDGYRIGRAGIIPVVKKNDENWWLLGSFWEDFAAGRILTDFGGMCKHNKDNKEKETPLECSLREMEEETKGLLNIPIEKAIENGSYTIFEGTYDKKRRKVYFYFVFVDYDDVKDIPDLFLRTEKTVKERLGPLNFYKQSEILSRKQRTARNLTDFVSFLNGYKH